MQGLDVMMILSCRELLVSRVLLLQFIRLSLREDISFLGVHYQLGRLGERVQISTPAGLGYSIHLIELVSLKCLGCVD